MDRRAPHRAWRCCSSSSSSCPSLVSSSFLLGSANLPSRLHPFRGPGASQQRAQTKERRQEAKILVGMGAEVQHQARAARSCATCSAIRFEKSMLLVWLCERRNVFERTSNVEAIANVILLLTLVCICLQVGVGQTLACTSSRIHFSTQKKDLLSLCNSISVSCEFAGKVPCGLL